MADNEQKESTPGVLRHGRDFVADPAETLKVLHLGEASATGNESIIDLYTLLSRKIGWDLYFLFYSNTIY